MIRNTILVGDVRDRLRELPNESVHAVITSPPYWALRDYGTATWLGGDPACEHRSGTLDADAKAGFAVRIRAGQDADVCRLCGAVRQDCQLGLEPTPEAYLEAMVAVFREVHRVLRADGTAWINMGDTFNSYNANAGPSLGIRRGAGADTQRPSLPAGYGILAPGLKPKDMVGIPWRLALALQADGWYLRRDIIWSKPNPMPESVRDRPTTTHEYIFMLSKRERYFYDAYAVREKVTGTTHGRTRGGSKETVPTSRIKNNSSFHAATSGIVSMRNRRSVWEVPTEPFKSAHFATFPRALIKPAILAATSEMGCCGRCGAPWRRVVHRETSDHEAVSHSGYESGSKGARMRLASQAARAAGAAEFYSEQTEIAWEIDCDCWPGAVRTAPIVLDPFMGAGTTALACLETHRDYVGTELSPEYAAIAEKRIARLKLQGRLL